MRFKTGDIIENLWAGENNPSRKRIFIHSQEFFHFCYLWFWNGIQISFITEKDVQRWEDDPEHYKVIGHCEIERFVSECLNKKE